MCLPAASRTSRTRERTGTSSIRSPISWQSPSARQPIGAESYEDIVLYGKSKTSWLSEFLELKGGIPSHDTFRRVFSLIDAEAFEACFTEWAKSQAEDPDGELVAIDGKTIRRSFDHGKEQSPLHVVSAWASSQSLVLAQEVVDEKSNEITAIPEAKGCP